MKVLGVPVGHKEFIKAQLRMKSAEQLRLLERIPAVENVQAGWLLLSFCAATRSNYWLRTVCPELTAEFAAEHDRNVWRCLAEILRVGDVERSSIASSSLPLTFGGVGVGGALRIRDAAHWGSWADCLEMVRARHPQVAEDIIRGMHGRVSDCLSAVQDCAAHLQDVGAQLPTWEALAGGVRPATSLEEEKEPSEARGWQKHASVSVQSYHREHVVWPQLNPAERAMVRSQSGPLSSVPFTAMPTNRVTRFEAEQFRVLLLRRLRLPLPLSVRSCRCGRLLDALGHHRAACSRSGVLGRRGFAVESAVAQICREGGAQVSTNVMLRDLDISPPQNSDGRRLEVVAEGLTSFGGCQLALDATLVSPLQGDGSHRRGADITDGTALGEARKDKVRTYPELCRGNGRALLVVIAGEVGGRWSDETKSFLWCLASAKAAAVTGRLFGSARAAWYRRWTCMLACSAAKGFASSLVGVRGSPGAGDQVPSVHEVLADARHFL